MTKRSFEQWVDGIFNHPVDEPAWHFAEDADHCIEDDLTNVEYLTRLFLECDRVLAPFDNAQADQGLNFIAFSVCSRHAYTVTRGKADWSKRRACINAIYDLYAKCFAARCTPGLSMRDVDKIDNPLNCICYMWWDIFPIQYDIDNAPTEVVLECIKVMERCLTLTHPACLEGTLHGLGHLRDSYPSQIESMTTEFLRRRTDLRPELADFASQIARNI